MFVRFMPRTYRDPGDGAWGWVAGMQPGDALHPSASRSPSFRVRTATARSRPCNALLDVVDHVSGAAAGGHWQADNRCRSYWQIASKAPVPSITSLHVRPEAAQSSWTSH